jgi:nitrile hydratase beta subunit
MNGVHDMCGAHGFGPVPIDLDEPEFHEDWERRLFGVKTALNGHGIPKNLDQGRYDVETLPAEVYMTASYYERWLLAAEKEVVRAGVLTDAELEERRRAIEANPLAPLPSHRDDEYVERAVAGARRGRPTKRETSRPRAFAVGDRVVTRNLHHAGHTRLARYARGRRGVVIACYDAFDLPERAVLGEERPDHLYGVRFEAAEMWGESAEPNVAIFIDLFESYLLPA